MFTKKFLVVLSLALAVLVTGSVVATATDDAVVQAVNNFLKDIHEQGWYVVTPKEVNTQRKVRQNLFILDVRTPGEVEEGTIPGAVTIRLSDLAQSLDKLPEEKDTTIYAYCKSGTRSAFAAASLHVLGFTEAYTMAGGIMAWKEAGYPVEE
ncbi:MAG: rhodanese-like domain-containing protein [Candidatus Bipolaricaulota bacterium]